MASGDVHHNYLRKGWAVAFPLSILMYLMMLSENVSYPYLYGIFSVVNYLLCELIDPDNDQLALTLADGIALRLSRKFYLGFIGAIFVSYNFLYAYIAGLFGGHRSWFSHGWIVGTLGRMIFYNSLLLFIFYNIYSFGILKWGWQTNISLYQYFYMNIWLKPYLITQFIMWNIGDGIHLLLDTSWAKGRLYKPKKSIRK